MARMASVLATPRDTILDNLTGAEIKKQRLWGQSLGSVPAVTHK